MSLHKSENSSGLNVGLFVTCLVDFFRPGVAFATAHLIEASGARVFVPEKQTCCGQIPYNSGNKKAALEIALSLVKVFESADYVVIPSGSCAAMLKCHLLPLLESENELSVSPIDIKNAKEFSKKCFELTDFLVNIMKFSPKAIDNTTKRIVYHDSCSGLRELNIYDQPRTLLRDIGINEENNLLTAPSDQNRCCGFGGVFCVSCPDVSAKMADDKITCSLQQKSEQQKPEIFVAGDLGCLLHISGRMSYNKQLIEVRHIAEILSKAIGKSENVDKNGIAE